MDQIRMTTIALWRMVCLSMLIAWGWVWPTHPACLGHAACLGQSQAAQLGSSVASSWSSFRVWEVQEPTVDGEQDQLLEVSPDAVARPAWAFPGERHDGDLTFCVLESEPHLSTAGAKRELMQKIRVYLREQALSITEYFPEHGEEQFTDDYIIEKLIYQNHLTVMPVQNEITAAASAALGKPQVGYVAMAELQLKPDFRRAVVELVRETQIRSRAGLFGLGYLGVISTLAIAVVYLKIDAATRHHYSRRLMIFAVAIWMAISGVSWLVFQRLAGE